MIDKLLSKLVFLPEPVLKFLELPIITTKFLVIDFWSFVHLGSGLTLGYFIKNPYIAFGIIVVYELFELFLVGRSIITPESLGNIVWDVIVGMAGYFLIRYLMTL